MPKLPTALTLHRALHIVIFGLGLVLLPMAAQAQVAPLAVWVDQKFYITLNSPTLAQGDSFLCAPRQAGCKPLNQSSCTDPSIVPISFNVGPGAAGLPTYTGTSQVLYAFLSTTGSCIYSTITGQTGNNPNLLIGTTSSLPASAPFFSGGTQTFNFPSGVSSINPMLPDAAATKQYTVADVMQALGVCNGAGVQMATYQLCVGVDAAASGGIGNATTTAPTSTTSLMGTQATSNDAVTYLQFQVDTLPPDPPTITSVRSLNGRCQVKVNYTNGPLDLYSVQVHYSHNPANINVPCNLWTDDVQSTPAQSAYGQTSGELTFSVENLDNNVTYAFCAESEDYMQNVSAPTDNALGQPRFECDLFACYPDTLRVGYCGQFAGGQLWLLTASALAARTWLMRRRRGLS